MMQVPCTTQLFDEDGQIVAVCPELDVSSFGDTPQEALANLQEAVTLFPEECQRMGTLETVLEEACYRREPFAPLRTKLASMGTLSSVSGAEDPREMSWVKKRLKKALDNTEVTVES